MIFGPPHRKNFGVRSEVRVSAGRKKFFGNEKKFSPRRENVRARKKKIKFQKIQLYFDIFFFRKKNSWILKIAAKIFFIFYFFCGGAPKIFRRIIEFRQERNKIFFTQGYFGWTIRN